MQIFSYFYSFSMEKPSFKKCQSIPTISPRTVLNSEILKIPYSFSLFYFRVSALEFFILLWRFHLLYVLLLFKAWYSTNMKDYLETQMNVKKKLQSNCKLSPPILESLFRHTEIYIYTYISALVCVHVYIYITHSSEST